MTAVSLVTVAALTFTAAGAGSGAASTGAIPSDTSFSFVSAADGTSQEDTSSTDGGGQKLPDSISGALSDSDIIVSSELAQTQDGTLVDVATGEEITDPDLVGTPTTAPDPLEKSDGVHYVPVSVGEARETAENSEGSGTLAAAGTDGVAHAATVAETVSSKTPDLVAEDGYTAENVTNLTSQYGVYWGTDGDGRQAIFNKNGSVALSGVKKVIDVSEHQRKAHYDAQGKKYYDEINWEKVKESGVEGAIIRVGYAWGNPLDKGAAYNVSECLRLGIPFGLYLYSYAATEEEATQEAKSVLRYLKELGIDETDLAYPIYYDLEPFSWTGHPHPTEAETYTKLVKAFVTTLEDAGITHISVYSYLNYLNTALNSDYIHERTTWVAQYSAKLQYTDWRTEERGWQYTSSGTVDGIEGSVDLDAITPNIQSDPLGGKANTLYRVYNPGSGEHLYTTDLNERRTLIATGWSNENIAWISPTEGRKVYRLYNPVTGEHHYTLGAYERDTLVTLGWTYEGVSWRSGGEKPVYCLYNPRIKAASHHYTTDLNERDTLTASYGWTYEGVGWYALSDDEVAQIEEAAAEDAEAEAAQETADSAAEAAADSASAAGEAAEDDAENSASGTGDTAISA